MQNVQFNIREHKVQHANTGKNQTQVHHDPQKPPNQGSQKDQTAKKEFFLQISHTSQL